MVLLEFQNYNTKILGVLLFCPTPVHTHTCTHIYIYIYAHTMLGSLYDIIAKELNWALK